MSDKPVSKFHILSHVQMRSDNGDKNGDDGGENSGGERRAIDTAESDRTHRRRRTPARRESAPEAESTRDREHRRQRGPETERALETEDRERRRQRALETESTGECCVHSRKEGDGEKSERGETRGPEQGDIPAARRKKKGKGENNNRVLAYILIRCRLLCRVERS